MSIIKVLSIGLAIAGIMTDCEKKIDDIKSYIV